MTKQVGGLTCGKSFIAQSVDFITALETLEKRWDDGYNVHTVASELEELNRRVEKLARTVLKGDEELRFRNNLEAFQENYNDLHGRVQKQLSKMSSSSSSSSVPLNALNELTKLYTLMTETHPENYLLTVPIEFDLLSEEVFQLSENTQEHSELQKMINACDSLCSKIKNKLNKGHHSLAFEILFNCFNCLKGPLTEVEAQRKKINDLRGVNKCEEVNYYLDEAELLLRKAPKAQVSTFSTSDHSTNNS